MYTLLEHIIHLKVLITKIGVIKMPGLRGFDLPVTFRPASCDLSFSSVTRFVIVDFRPDQS